MKFISSPPVVGLIDGRIPLATYKLGPVSSMNIMPSLSLELAGFRSAGSVAQIPVQSSAIAMKSSVQWPFGLSYSGVSLAITAICLEEKKNMYSGTSRENNARRIRV